MLLGSGQDTLQADNEQLTNQVRANVLRSPTQD
jgi:hypothetical protein